MANENRFKKAQESYKKAYAEQLRVENIDKQAKNIVLKNNKFYTEDEGDRIINPEKDYLMSDADFNTYFELVHKERNRLGLDIPNSSLSSDYKSRVALRKAEDELLSCAKTFAIAAIPDMSNYYWKKLINKVDTRKKLLELTFKLNWGWQATTKIVLYRHRYKRGCGNGTR